MSDNLTENEIVILKACRTNCFGDAGNFDEYYFERYPYVSGVIDQSKLPAKIARGVISSLIKKDYVEIIDSEDEGKAKDMVIGFTQKAFKLCSDNGLLELDKCKL